MRDLTSSLPSGSVAGPPGSTAVLPVSIVVPLRTAHPRLRQAYDELARPAHLAAELAIVPVVVMGGTPGGRGGRGSEVVEEERLPRRLLRLVEPTERGEEGTDEDEHRANLSAVRGLNPVRSTVGPGRKQGRRASSRG